MPLISIPEIGVIPGLQTALDAKLVKASNLADVTSLTDARTNLGLGVGAVSFLPLDIADLKQWLDAGRMHDVADGASVGTWVDASGNGNSYIQATSSKRPVRQLNIQNGRPGVLFDGVDDFLDGVAISNTHTNAAFSQFVVFKPQVLNNATDSYSGESVFTTVGGYFGLTVKSNGQFDCYNYDGSYDVLTDVGSIAENAVTLAELHHSGGTLSARGDGGPLASVASGNTSAMTDVNRIGARYNATGGFFQGWILELLTYNRALTWAERTKVWDYLRLKYNTP